MLFSIITCAYNPNPAVLVKLVKAVNALRIDTRFDYEWLIVDNGSKPFVNDVFLLKKSLSEQKHISIIRESKAGLTNARITGLNQSKGDWILFLDDDNEPVDDYLLHAYTLIHKYPFVKCWGPGHVNVRLLDPRIQSWIANRKDMFQEKHINNVIFSNEKMWSICHPAGTGMLIDKNILTGYVESVEKGRYTLTDRLGKSLSSGGDTQIVFHAVDQGMHVGLAPDLVINHNIEPRKSTFKYLKKQTYAGCKSFIKAHNEVLTNNRYELIYKDNVGVAKRVARWLIGNYKQLFSPIVALDFFALLGNLHAPYFASDQNPPRLLKWLVYVFVNDKK
ncbi:glycosyltransferase family 2 protein [Spirosoma oryzicola]|uniref:glycosyltransferase family 2 protein n=1 Tax=Spirosoma oryzicola TaxID=2898794 RepID=UPI001E5B0A24|nr:glycosyltransferase family 2 protein [Spirosoma oryzicola]UHG94045.1 glycosyltransferase [Spirosoma oryzicola]